MYEGGIQAGKWTTPRLWFSQENQTELQARIPSDASSQLFENFATQQGKEPWFSNVKRISSFVLSKEETQKRELAQIENVIRAVLISEYKLNEDNLPKIIWRHSNAVTSITGRVLYFPELVFDEQSKHAYLTIEGTQDCPPAFTIYFTLGEGDAQTEYPVLFYYQPKKNNVLPLEIVRAHEQVHAISTGVQVGDDVGENFLFSEIIAMIGQQAEDRITNKTGVLLNEQVLLALLEQYGHKIHNESVVNEIIKLIQLISSTYKNNGAFARDLMCGIGTKHVQKLISKIKLLRVTMIKTRPHIRVIGVTKFLR